MGDISIVSILTRMLATATPLAIMGVGGLFGERAGIVNIGLDGNLLIGAFSAAIISYYTQSAWLGLLGAGSPGLTVILMPAGTMVCALVGVMAMALGRLVADAAALQDESDLTV